ncbi:MAG TPA: hypothetical protein VMZ90_06360 [Vicinamibacterales bacterium]|nr:hypothetical protein [Vicinamibacterales bacterium]
MVRRILLLVLVAVLCLPLVHFATLEWGPKPQIDFNGAEWKARKELMTRARVFVKSPPDIRTLDMSRTPKDPDPIDPSKPVECRYVQKPFTATTAKFHCELPDGDLIKVKYGWTPEKSGEVAASRLLAALGFGADHVAMLPRLRCIGCPMFPFEMQEFAEAFYAPWLIDLLRAKDQPRDFTWVSAERKMAGRAIEVDPYEGWDWDELKTVDAGKGGATRAELDALRLMAVFLSHWDNKATNQRLVCEERKGAGDDPREPCRTPLLVLQDVGATFGPTKVKHKKWAASPIWSDAPGCVTSLESMPYEGGRFEPTHISEEGRALLAGKLTQFSDQQVRALFEGAHFPAAGGDADGDVSAWVKTFQEKVRQIADRSCGSPLP